MVWMHSSLPIDQLMATWASSNLPFMDKTAAGIRYRRLFCENMLSFIFEIYISLYISFYTHTYTNK